MTAGDYTVPCLTVAQPIGTFYIAMMKAGDLLSRVQILRRGLTEESQENIQRELNRKRVKEIAQYISDPDATFPTSIIVAAYPHRVSLEGDQPVQRLVFHPDRAPEDGSLETEGADAPPGIIGEVVDGQHRLKGLEEAAKAPGSNAAAFELPVVFMLGLDPEHRAYVFSTINSKQNRVSSSLIFDLFGLAQHRGPRRTCHEVASAMNVSEGGPLFQGLKMLGKKSRASESLTQGSFAKYLLLMIANDPDKDERDLKRGGHLEADASCPFRQFFISNRDDMILRILTSYLGAIKDAYPTAWNNAEDYALRRTVGFAALMMSLQRLWPIRIAPTGKATPDVFAEIASSFKRNVPENDLKGIPSSGAEAGKLRDRWLQAGG